MLGHSLFTLHLFWCTYPQSVSLSPFFSYLWSNLHTPATLIWPSFSSSQRPTASSCSLYLNSPTWWKGPGPVCLQLSLLLTTIWKGASLCSGQWKWSVISKSGNENRSQEFCPQFMSSRICISIQVWAVSRALKYHPVLSLQNVPLHIQPVQILPVLEGHFIPQAFLVFPVWGDFYLFWAPKAICIFHKISLQ